MIHTPSSLPLLPQVQSINRFQHQTLGRVGYLNYRASVGAGAEYGAALLDSENDGVFETFFVDEHADLLDSPVLDATLWLDNYLTYQ